MKKARKTTMKQNFIGKTRINIARSWSREFKPKKNSDLESESKSESDNFEAKGQSLKLKSKNIIFIFNFRVGVIFKLFYY